MNKCKEDGDTQTDTEPQGETDAIIGMKDGGLIVLPRGELPDGLMQPISQTLFRIDGSSALILSKHTRREYEFGAVQLYNNKIVVIIPVKQ